MYMVIYFFLDILCLNIYCITVLIYDILYTYIEKYEFIPEIDYFFSYDKR